MLPNSRWNPRVAVAPPGPESRKALKRMHQVIGRADYMGLYGVVLKGSSGTCIEDLDGNRYLDCLSGAAVNVLGYDAPQVVSAYADAAKAIQQTCFSYTPSLPAIELAEHLARITPGNHHRKVLFELSGSNSMDAALQIAWRVTGKDILLRFQNAYHGSTWLSKTLNGFAPPRSRYFSRHHFATLPFPTNPRLSEQVIEAIELHLSQGNVAGLVFETVQGDGGGGVALGSFFKRAAPLLRRHGALLIADEVQTGMGRTGTWWGIDQEEIIPDLMVTGKALGAGFAPISALVGRAELVDALDQGAQITSFKGHPPSCAAAIETIKTIERHNLLQHAAQMGKRLLSGFRTLVEEYPDIFVQARGRGLILSLECQVGKNPLACRIFAMRCVEKGLYLGYWGRRQEALLIVPPLIFSREDVQTTLSIIKEVAEETRSGKIPDATIQQVSSTEAVGFVLFGGSPAQPEPQSTHGL